MPMSDYFKELRAKIGNQLLVSPSVTGIILDEKSRILLLRHSEGDVWVAPGGSVEPNENPADALIREVWEESGLLVEPVKILGVFGGEGFEVTYKNGDRVSYVMTVFACKVTGGKLKADGVETLQAGYFSREEIVSIQTPTWILNVLPYVYDDTGWAYFRPGTWSPGSTQSG